MSSGATRAALLAVGAWDSPLQYGVTNVLNLRRHHDLGFVDYAVGEEPGHLAGDRRRSRMGRTHDLGYRALPDLGDCVRRGTSLFGMAMVTIALGLVIEFGLESIRALILHTTRARRSLVHLGSVIVSVEQLVIIGAAVVIMLAVHALSGTRAWAWRARDRGQSLTRPAAPAGCEWRGWCPARCAGLPGVFLITQGSFSSSTGEFFITLVAAAIVGRIGKPYRPWSALIVGTPTSEGAAAMISHGYGYVVAFVILVVVLMVRTAAESSPSTPAPRSLWDERQRSSSTSGRCSSSSASTSLPSGAWIWSSA